MIDLTPATGRMAGLLATVTDEELGMPTPCERMTLGDLIDHVDGLSLAFTWAAAKDPRAAEPGQGPSADAARLGDDWRERLPRRLDALAEAWRDPAAWSGMTRAGGIDLPGEVAGLVALDELVVHGWDIARSLGRPYTCSAEETGACLEFVSQAPEDPEPDSGLFGPPVRVPEDAPPLDRLIGRTGRDPHWKP
ncbi:TIGR03086 family metal-binding protein [Actinomadura viridis]|uniref:TIGR03086 family metal-binding protein n=1 Tax=Actinomadura viridis TaxID=58110 RepID=UPI0036CE4A92